MNKSMGACNYRAREERQVLRRGKRGKGKSPRHLACCLRTVEEDVKSSDEQSSEYATPPTLDLTGKSQNCEGI